MVTSCRNNAADKADEGLHYSPSPITFKTPQISPPRTPPLLLLFSPSPPPSSHHSPSPCSRILQYKPGTDVCRGRAERPRCSGCQPHAFHWEMKAHSSPSCEANFKKTKKKKRKKGWKKLSKCLQVPSEAVHIWAHLFVSSPPCIAATGMGFL